MDVSFLPQLDPRSTYYCETFLAYKRHTNENEKILEWISERFEEEIISRLSFKENKGKDGNFTLSVLGIGSGDGKFEVEMLKKLLKTFRYIVWTVVEPSAESIASYKKLVEENGLNSVTFNWRQTTLQEFCKDNFDGSKKFHLVCAIHSMYYIPIPDLDYYMKTLFEWTDGKILMMHVTESGANHHIQRKFERTPYSRGNNIEDSLKKMSIPFQTSDLSDELDVTCCFQEDSQDGKLALDFILHRVGCRDDGPQNF